jgi:hypothetical protein
MWADRREKKSEKRVAFASFFCMYYLLTYPVSNRSSIIHPQPPRGGVVTDGAVARIASQSKR